MQYCPVGKTTDGAATSAADCTSPFGAPSYYTFSCPLNTNCWPVKYRSKLKIVVGSLYRVVILLSERDTFPVTKTDTYTLNMARFSNDGWHGAEIHITNNGTTKVG